MHPPIQPAQIVAGNIFAIFGELDARTAVQARVLARYVALHRPSRK
jgi:hypothetical protein